MLTAVVCSGGISPMCSKEPSVSPIARIGVQQDAGDRRNSSWVPGMSSSSRGEAELVEDDQVDPAEVLMILPTVLSAQSRSRGFPRGRRR